MAAEKYFYNNKLADATVITLTNEDASYPKENAYDNHPSIETRTTVITECTYTVDFGAAISLDGFSIHNTNITSGNKTTLKVEADAAGTFAPADKTDDFTLQARTLNGVARNDAYYLIGSPPWTYRYFRFRFQINALTYMSFGQFGFWQDVYTAVDSMGMYSVDRNVIKKDSVNERTGHISREITGRLQVYSFPYPKVSTTQRDLLMDIEESGYVSFMPEGTSENIYFGLFNFEQFGMLTTDATRVFNGSGQFTEVFA